MPWHLAVLGAGSAAAYYLNTLDRSLYPKIVVIGLEDPWAGHRGGNLNNPNDPVNIINQNESMIGHFGSTVPATSDQLVSRSAWAKENKRIIDQCKVDRVHGAVLNVKKVPTTYLNERDRAAMNGATHCYAIQVSRKNFTETYYAPKVVVATGAGEHKPPDDRFPKFARQHPTLFMDMDTFGRHPEMRAPGKTIIVQGPNAAVDSADTAAFNKCTVYWLTGTPAILATPHQTGARAVQAGNDPKVGRIYPLNRKEGDPKSISVEGGTKIKVTLQSGVVLIADHYVWGVGQDSKGAVKFIDPGLLNSLEPIYDKNQRFGAAHESVLGFQLEGTIAKEGLEVVGALARQVMLARIEDKHAITHTYLRDMASLIEELKSGFVYWNQVLADHGWNFLLEPVDKLSTVPAKKLVQTITFAKRIIAQSSPTWNLYFQALGAMIINWAIANEYLAKNGSELKDADLNNAVGILTPSTVGAAQLGSIRTTTSAINAHMPTYISLSHQPGGNVNFSHDDQTVLRAFIAVNYPCVPEEDCRRIIAKMIAGRRSRDNSNPNKEVTPGNWGYQDNQIRQFRNELRALNDHWAGIFTTAKTVGTGKTVLGR